MSTPSVDGASSPDVPAHDVVAHDLHGPAGAPVVVLGSSLGTTRTMWDEQLPPLAERFRVLRYDHLGHGDSPVPAGPYSIARLASEVIRLLDHLGVRRAHHVGLSLGGMVAMRLAADHPDRVDRLTVVCSSAHMPPASAWLQRAEDVRSGGLSEVADSALERWFTPAFAGSARATALLAGLRASPAEGYAACCEAIAVMDLRPDLGRIQAPTLVVAGEQDPATPVEMGAEVVQRITAGGGTARLETVPGAAHLGSVEQADRVTSLLLAHLGTGPAARSRSSAGE